MIEDIVYRLHKCAEWHKGTNADCDEWLDGANEITRLREENARLREELEGLQEIVARKYEIGTEVEVGDDE